MLHSLPVWTVLLVQHGSCFLLYYICSPPPPIYQVLSDERSRKRYDYALAHPEEDIQVRMKRFQR
jgi:hypothetical protein